MGEKEDDIKLKWKKERNLEEKKSHVGVGKGGELNSWLLVPAVTLTSPCSPGLPSHQ